MRQDYLAVRLNADLILTIAELRCALVLQHGRIAVLLLELVLLEDLLTAIVACSERRVSHISLQGRLKRRFGTRAHCKRPLHDELLLLELAPDDTRQLRRAQLHAVVLESGRGYRIWASQRVDYPTFMVTCALDFLSVGFACHRMVAWTVGS